MTRTTQDPLQKTAVAGVKPPPIPPPVAGREPTPPPLPAESEVANGAATPSPEPQSPQPPANPMPDEQASMLGVRWASALCACVATIAAISLLWGEGAKAVRTMAAKELLNRSVSGIPQGASSVINLTQEIPDPTLHETQLTNFVPGDVVESDVVESDIVESDVVESRVVESHVAEHDAAPTTRSSSASSDAAPSNGEVEGVSDENADAASESYLVGKIDASKKNAVPIAESFTTSSPELSSAMEGKSAEHASAAGLDFVDFDLVAEINKGLAIAKKAAPEACSSQKFGTLIDWVESPEKAQALAREQGKMVLLILVSGNFAREEFT